MPSGVYVRTKKRSWKLSEESLKNHHSFQKGHKLNLGEINSLWKGELASISAIHQWLVYHYGNPVKCEDCGKLGKPTGKKERWSIHWSNCDHKYRRVREDYFGRCDKCHRQYDIKMGLVGWDNNGRIVKLSPQSN